ncbi:alpha/beta hydrolase [Paenarthrobacter nicotinovorans]|uniref:alpha/beta hydrolase n=1 Tax=Paenarthrobacter nicotinovorans TaxID=29320 RepID=UPI000478B0D6|nr:alpha/beta hydrolase [Paenarthrobacter nicotinovorans]
MPFHPDIAHRLPLLDGIPSLEAGLSDPSMRAQMEAFDAYPDAPPPPAATTRMVSVPGPHGPVPVRIYTPAGQSPAGQSLDTRPGHALVWMHGGAFQFGDLDTKEADWTARQLVQRASATIVSVNYRLAVNGVHYPVPLDDVVAAIRWVQANMVELGITSLSLGGASAGANLAAGAALRLRDEDNWVPDQLVLVYPLMHAVPPAPSASLRTALSELPDAMRLTPRMIDSASENYLGTSSDVPAPGYAMPANADLDGLGPTLVLNAEYDELRASGEAFSALLAACGVDVEQVRIPGMLHGFLNLPATFAPVNQALERIADRLRPRGR